MIVYFYMLDRLSGPSTVVVFSLSSELLLWSYSSVIECSIRSDVFQGGSQSHRMFMSATFYTGISHLADRCGKNPNACSQTTPYWPHSFQYWRVQIILANYFSINLYSETYPKVCSLLLALYCLGWISPTLYLTTLLPEFFQHKHRKHMHEKICPFLESSLLKHSKFQSSGVQIWQHHAAHTA